MKVFYSDGQLVNQVRTLRLVKLADQWHVAGEAYLCEVDSYQEGINLIEQIRSRAKRCGVAIEQAPDASSQS